MYVPAHFKPADDDVRDLLRNLGAADLITSTSAGLLATMLPLVWLEPEPGSAGWGVLHGHVARNNQQWKEPPIGDAMAIVRGPDAYISPAWYATKREHGRVVPTWNYITAHVYGRLVIHDDPAWVEVNVRRLSERHERARAGPGRSTTRPSPTSPASSRRSSASRSSSTASRASGSSARTVPRADIAGTIEGLEATGEREVSAAMRGVDHER